MTYLADGEDSGVYNQPTFDAVEKFQQDLALDLKASAYGLVGKKTFNAIIENSGTWTNSDGPIGR